MKGIVSRSRVPYPAVGQSVVEKLPNIVVPGDEKYKPYSDVRGIGEDDLSEWHHSYI
ncbi:hypothetical protein J6590_009420 [Homalodisca vitripennis]|nr:hypothetical protein J6590_009420 [Homalodisca vitripennis]